MVTQVAGRKTTKYESRQRFRQLDQVCQLHFARCETTSQQLVLLAVWKMARQENGREIFDRTTEQLLENVNLKLSKRTVEDALQKLTKLGCLRTLVSGSNHTGRGLAPKREIVNLRAEQAQEGTPQHGPFSQKGTC